MSRRKKKRQRNGRKSLEPTRWILSRAKEKWCCSGYLMCVWLRRSSAIDRFLRSSVLFLYSLNVSLLNNTFSKAKKSLSLAWDDLRASQINEQRTCCSMSFCLLENNLCKERKETPQQEKKIQEWGLNVETLDVFSLALTTNTNAQNE